MITRGEVLDGGELFLSQDVHGRAFVFYTVQFQRAPVQLLNARHDLMSAFCPSKLERLLQRQTNSRTTFWAVHGNANVAKSALKGTNGL